MKLVKGKFRVYLLALFLFTIIILIYISFFDERSYGKQLKSPTSPNGSQNGDKMYELNELLPLTRPKDNVEATLRQEKQMLDNVQKMIKHKLRPDSSFDQPSLWNGIAGEQAEAVIGQQRVVLEKRMLHLDLKGAPPLISYFKQLFPFLRSLGVTGLLIEYEDMFPYQGLVEVLRAYNAYTPGEIEELLKLAEENELEVIPLIQAFGHMEFVLKSEQFRHLREVPAYPQAICPSNNFSLTVIQEMIDQVLRLHSQVKYLHIGCDEVYNIGECPLCQERLSKMGWSTDNLFLSHVTSVASYVKTKHRVQPIMWDDMFRQVTEEAIVASDIGKYTDILVWKYSSEVEEAIGQEIWLKYAKCFQGIWIGSAFKGASNPLSFATNIQERLENHRSWLTLLQKYRHIPIKGVFMTGWQRYDHFATLCELLPAGLPSFAVNLQYLIHHNYEPRVARKVQALLGCNRAIPLALDAFDTEITCSFPGSRIYELSLNFYTLNFYLEDQFFGSNYVKGWLSEFNVKTRFSSPALLMQATLRYADGVRNVSIFRNSMMEALSLVYDNYTVNEWIETLVKPILVRLDNYMADIKLLVAQSTWPRRPLTFKETDNKQEQAVYKTAVHAVEP